LSLLLKSKKLNKSDIEFSASLAKIAIDENDIVTYANDINAILNFINTMNEVDTTNITPMAHPHDITTTHRQDEAEQKAPRDLLQSNAKETDDGLFLVPKVIE
jgi:aspartyl-tRNA(Asn)/glutamyl-tRNA(Gln) amidotransferase subunit C